MENELISMVAYVLGNLTSDAHHSCHLMQKYANFLNTPLNISMFVPAIEVDGKWEVLEMPGGNSHDIYGQPIYDNYVSIQEYQQAKDRVLFEGFDVEVSEACDELSFDVWNESIDLWMIYDPKENIIIKGDTEIQIKTIQDLIKYAPTLTEYGKQISGLNK